MIRLLTHTGIIVGVLALLVTAVLAIGEGLASPEASLLAPGTCVQPCWQGIRPGQTTLRNAQAQLKANSLSPYQTTFQSLEFVAGNDNFRLCWETPARPTWQGCATNLPRPDEPMDLIKFLRIRYRKDVLRLGEAIAVFGRPISAMQCWESANRWVNAPAQPFVATFVAFSGQVQLVAFDRARLDGRRLDPAMTVLEVWYDTSGIVTPNMPWRGFTAAFPPPNCS
jgi:hypothetical protein